MAKFDELNEDIVKELSLEELQQLALSGKEELIKSRSVIGDLNKKIKGKTGEEGENTNNFSREELDEYYAQKKREETFESFVTENNLDEDAKTKAKDLFEKGLSNEDIGKIVGVNSFAHNINKSNNLGVGGGQLGGQQSFSGKVLLSEYKSMSPEEQGIYKQFARKNYGGLAFAIPKSDD